MNKVIPVLLMALLPSVAEAGVIESSYTAIAKFLESAAAMIGLYLFFDGIKSFYKHTEDPREYPIKRAWSGVLSGSLLMASAYTFIILSNTLSADTSWLSDRSYLDVQGNLNNIQGGGTPEGSFFAFIPGHLESTILGFIMLIGIYSFLKGLYLIYDSGSDPKQERKKNILVHLISGMILYRFNSISIYVSNLIN